MIISIERIGQSLAWVGLTDTGRHGPIYTNNTPTVVATANQMRQFVEKTWS